MNDSWQIGMKKLQIPRPKMMVTRQDQRQRRPVDPPRDYNLTDDVNDAVDAAKSHNCCGHDNRSSNNSDSSFL